LRRRVCVLRREASPKLCEERAWDIRLLENAPLQGGRHDEWRLEAVVELPEFARRAVVKLVGCCPTGRTR
jgi:hypothetical protein